MTCRQESSQVSQWCVLGPAIMHGRSGRAVHVCRCGRRLHDVCWYWTKGMMTYDRFDHTETRKGTH